MSQLLNSLLTLIGVLTMMVIISRLLALDRAGLGAPVDRRDHVDRQAVPAVVRASSGRRPAGSTATSRRSTPGTRSSRCSATRQEAEEVFRERNEALYQASFGAQFLSGIILPCDHVHREPELRPHRRHRRPAGGVGQPCRWATSRRSSSTRASSASRSRRSPRCPTCCSQASPRPSGSSSCSTHRGAGPRPRGPRAASTDPKGRVAFEHVSFRYEADVPLITDLSLVAAPGQSVAIVGPTGAGKTTLVNLDHALLRDRLRPHHPRRRRHRDR